MREFDACVYKKYPGAFPTRAKGRPWWYFEGFSLRSDRRPDEIMVDGDNVYLTADHVRSDGKKLQSGKVRVGKFSSYYGMPNYSEDQAKEWRAELVPDLSAFDSANPIPHPGYRTGQIWILVDGEKILSEVTILGFDGDEFYTTSDAKSWSCAHPVLAGHYPPHPNAFFPKIPLLNYQLLFDPICPHLAPWSPKE